MKKQETSLGIMLDCSRNAVMKPEKVKEFITKIVNSLIYDDKKVEKFFKQIELVLNNYIKKKIS